MSAGKKPLLSAKNTIVGKVYRCTFEIINKHRQVLLPFLIFAGIELFTLVILYIIPRQPLRPLLGPVITTFWGEVFLHYPSNFLLLPKLASLSRMVLAVFFGSLLTGMAVDMAYNAYNNRTIKPKASFSVALKRYLDLFLVVLALILLFYFSAKVIRIGLLKYFLSGHARLLFIGPQLWLGIILLAINFLLAVIIQALFVYAIPLAIIEKKKFFKAITGSIILFKELLIPTLFFVLLAMLLYLPVIILITNSAFLINKLFPEFIFWVCVLSTLVSSFVVDLLITVSATNLYLIKKEGR